MATEGSFGSEFLSKLSIILGSGALLCGVVAFLFKHWSSLPNATMNEAAANDSPVKTNKV